MVTTGTNRIYFHMAEFDLYKVTTINEEQTRRWDVYGALSNAVEEAKFAVQKYNYSSMVSYCNSIEEFKANATMTYPFTLTTDDANPALYAIKSGRGDNHWYTCNDAGKIVLNVTFDRLANQYWYFKEVVKNGRVYLQLYPATGEGKAISYNTTNQGGDKVIAQEVGTSGYRSNWLLVTGQRNGATCYGLQTEGKEVYLSNHGGATNAMGFYSKGPSDDDGTAMHFFAKPTYPFALTTDDAAPAYCAIKSGRGDAYWYTYTTDDAKISLTEYTGANTQLWYFKEITSPKYGHALQLYPAAGEGKAMSYQNISNDPAKIVAQTVGTDGWTSTWVLETTNGTAPYGLQTSGKENRLSNNGGTSNKMGMWNASPSSDGGSAMYFSDPAEILQALIDEADEILGHVGDAGYHTEAALKDLKTQTETSKTNLANKTSYSLSELRAEIAALGAEGVVYPTGDKYYQIKSAFPKFFNVQGKEMAMFSSENNNLAWKAVENYNELFYWTLIPTDDNKYLIKNVTGEYVCGLSEGDQYLMSTEKASAGKFTLTWLAPGQFNINGNGTMHAKEHNEGTGTNYRVSSWEQGANTPSAWTFEEFTADEYTVVEALMALKEVYEAKKYYSTEIVFGGLYGEGIGKYSGTDEYDIVEAFKAVDVLWAVDFKTQISGKVDIENLKTCLDDLTLTINQPATGKFYRIKSMNGNSENKKGKYVQNIVESVGLKLVADKDVNSILYYDGKSFLSYASGLYLEGYYNKDGDADVISKVGPATQTWTIGENKDIVGTYALSSTLSSGWYMSDWEGNNNTTFGQNDANAAWIFEEVVSLPVAVTSAGYATLYAPVALEIPEGVTVYTASVVDNYLDLTALDANDIIPANTGVIIEATQGTYNFDVVVDEVAPIEGNVLTGKYAKSEKNAGAKVYTLQNGANGVGFYLFKGQDANGAKTYINGFRSWVELPLESEVQGLRIRFADEEGGTTSIDDSQLTIDNATVIYDLTGRRIEKATEKGIYIVNGQKVVIK